MSLALKSHLFQPNVNKAPKTSKSSFSHPVIHLLLFNVWGHQAHSFAPVSLCVFICKMGVTLFISKIIRRIKQDQQPWSLLPSSTLCFGCS